MDRVIEFWPVLSTEQQCYPVLKVKNIPEKVDRKMKIKKVDEERKSSRTIGLKGSSKDHFIMPVGVTGIWRIFTVDIYIVIFMFDILFKTVKPHRY